MSSVSGNLTGSTIQGGGKRKVNKSLKAWVTFVKKVQKEEKLNYKEAIHRAKVRKDKGEKWMNGGGSISDMSESNMGESVSSDMGESVSDMNSMSGGRRRRSRTVRRRSSRRRSTRRR
jgi:hypothetical protein